MSFDVALNDLFTKFNSDVSPVTKENFEDHLSEEHLDEFQDLAFPNFHEPSAVVQQECFASGDNKYYNLSPRDGLLQQSCGQQFESSSSPSAIDNDDSENLAASRRSRSRHWPLKSTEYPQYPSFSQQRERAAELKIGRGMNAGRNLMAIFLDRDNTPRTRYKLIIERGRPLKQWSNAPSSDIVLPVGLTLAQICQHYSSHVWGTGLRLFMAEGWTGEEIWHALPEDARNDKAQHRKWNYLQQAMGREADRMYEEDNHPKRVPLKRKRVDSDDDFELVAADDKEIASCISISTETKSIPVQEEEATVKVNPSTETISAEEPDTVSSKFLHYEFPSRKHEQLRVPSFNLETTNVYAHKFHPRAGSKGPWNPYALENHRFLISSGFDVTQQWLQGINSPTSDVQLPTNPEHEENPLRFQTGPPPHLSPSSYKASLQGKQDFRGQVNLNVKALDQSVHKVHTEVSSKTRTGEYLHSGIANYAGTTDRKDPTYRTT